MARKKGKVARLFMLVVFDPNGLYDEGDKEMVTFQSKDEALDSVLKNYIKPKACKRVLRAFEVDDSGNVWFYELVFRDGELKFVALDSCVSEVSRKDNDLCWDSNLKPSVSTDDDNMTFGHLRGDEF